MSVILLADDDAAEAYLVVRAFKRAGVANEVRVVPDGESAMAYLEKSQPALVLLDQKLPGCSGLEVLQWMRLAERTADEIKHWWERNLSARAEFKARHGSDYLELQRAYEKRLAELATSEASPDVATSPETASQESPATPLLNDAEAETALKRLDTDIADCTSNVDLLRLEARWQKHSDKLPLWAREKVRERFAKAKAGDT